MEEYQIWTLFNSARVADAAVGIVSILAIWLALRVANLTRANPETDTIAKVVSTLFCGLIVLGSWQAWTIAAVNWTGTAGALSRLDNPSDFAKGFIDYVGQTEPATTPDIIGMLFLIVVALMTLVLIWRPKKD